MSQKAIANVQSSVESFPRLTIILLHINLDQFLLKNKRRDC